MGSTRPLQNLAPATSNDADDGGKDGGRQRSKHASEACERCRLKRSRCDGKRPLCSPCEREGAECTYSSRDRRKRRYKNQELEHLRDRIRQLEADLNARSEFATDSTSDVSPKPSTTLSSGSPSVTSPARLRTGGFDSRNTPPRNLLVQALEDFRKGSYGIFYVATQEHIDYLVHAVYEPSQEDLVEEDGEQDASPAVEKYAVRCSELCAIATMGWYYADPDDRLPVEFRDALFRSVTAHVWDSVSSDIDAGLRILVCISTVCLFQKRLASSRIFLAAGLEMGREQTTRAIAEEFSGENSFSERFRYSWRGLYRTIMMIDAWLVFSSGYGRLQANELDRVELEKLWEHSTFEDSVLSQIASISNIAAQGVSEIRSNRYPDTMQQAQASEFHLQRLRQWAENLPEEMLLSTVASNPEMSSERRRSVLVLHLSYLGGLMLLNFPQLLAAVEHSEDLAIRDTGSALIDGVRCEEAFRAADSLGRMLILVGNEPHIRYYCPIMVFDTYLTAIVLIFKSWIEVLNRAPDASKETMEQARSIVSLLYRYDITDRVSAAYFERLQPELRDLEKEVDRDATSAEANSARQASPTISTTSAQDGVQMYWQSNIEEVRKRLSVLLSQAIGSQSQIRVLVGNEEVVRELWG